MNVQRIISQEPRWIGQKDSSWQESIILTEHEMKWLQFLLKDHETMLGVKGGSVIIEPHELKILQSIKEKLDFTVKLMEAEQVKVTPDEEEE